MKVHILPAIVEVSKKRLGRGHGSGKGKTGGRGTKGQKARGTVRHGYEGGQVSLQHSLPFLRGKQRNHSQKAVVIAISIQRLKMFSDKDVVSVETLRKNKLIDSDVEKVKLIGNVPLSVALTIQGLSCSAGAKAAIEKAGGSVR